MARTLRGFDTDFPYLGARGDVTDADVPDASVVAEEEAYGAISDHVVQSMFGNMGPPGYVYDPRKGMRKVQTAAPVATGSAAAAMALHHYIMNHIGVGVDASKPERPVWGGSDTFTVRPPPGFHLDARAAEYATTHRSNAFKARPKSGGSWLYVFTDSPRIVSMWAKVYGMVIQRVSA
jgi:hypothetical protein